MSVLLIGGPKCMLVASHPAPWLVTASMPTGQTDGLTDGCQTVTLCFSPDAARVLTQKDKSVAHLHLYLQVLVRHLN